MPIRIGALGFAVLFLIAFGAQSTRADRRTLLIADEGEEIGSPKCEEFYDKWEMPGVPAAMLTRAGVGRELMAAQDCVDKGDAATACQHWSKVLEVTDKLGAPFNEDRDGIEQAMAEHDCNLDAESPEAPAGANDVVED